MALNCNALSSTLGLLQHLSIDELKEVLNDSDKFENIAKEAKIKGNDSSEKDLLMASNKSLAEYNLSKQDTFEDRRSQLIDVYRLLSEINSSVENQVSRIKEMSKKLDSESVLIALQLATSALERETDDISDKLLSGEIKLETFLEQYPSLRMKMHLRKAKLEKMTEMVSRRQSFKSNPTSSRITTITHGNTGNCYPNLQYSNAPAHIPYPLEPLNMPMPAPYL